MAQGRVDRPRAGYGPGHVERGEAPSEGEAEVSAPSRWTGYVSYSPAGDSFAVFVRAVYQAFPEAPPGSRQLGPPSGFATRREAIDEAIRYLTAERLVAEADAVNKRG